MFPSVKVQPPRLVNTKRATSPSEVRNDHQARQNKKVSKFKIKPVHLARHSKKARQASQLSLGETRQFKRIAWQSLYGKERFFYRQRRSSPGEIRFSETYKYISKHKQKEETTFQRAENRVKHGMSEFQRNGAGYNSIIGRSSLMLIHLYSSYVYQAIMSN